MHRARRRKSTIRKKRKKERKRRPVEQGKPRELVIKMVAMLIRTVTTVVGNDNADCDKAYGICHKAIHKKKEGNENGNDNNNEEEETKDNEHIIQDKKQ